MESLIGLGQLFLDVLSKVTVATVLILLGAYLMGRLLDRSHEKHKKKEKG